MIEAVIGLVGGGKSYSCVRRMCAYMAAGGRVVSNIQLSGFCRLSGQLCPTSPVVNYLRSLGWAYQPGQYVFVPFETMVEDPTWFKAIPSGQSRERRVLLCVDEATDLFDNLDRDKVRADSGYRALFRFLRLSRHAHIDVVFICQDVSAINSRLRNLVGAYWRVTDMRNFRFAKMFRMPFPFDVFLLQKFDRTGKMEMRREWLRKDRRIFGLYRSEAFADDVGVRWDGVAVGDGRVLVKKERSWPMWVKICAVLALLCSFGALALGWRSAALPAVSAGVVTNFVQVVEQRRAPVVVPSNRYVRARLVYGQAGERRWTDVDGARVEEGGPSEWGRVERVDRRYVLCRDGDVMTWILPLVEDRAAEYRPAPVHAGSL